MAEPDTTELGHQYSGRLGTCTSQTIFFEFVSETVMFLVVA